METSAEEGHSVFTPRTRRPTTSSLSRKPTLSFSRNGTLGRTKSLLMLGSKPSSSSVHHLCERFDDTLTMDYPPDKKELVPGESERYQQHTRRGSIRSMLKNAARNSLIKSKISRHRASQNLETPQLPYAAESSSTIHKWYRAVSSRITKHDSSLEIQEDYGVHPTSSPGNGNDPPYIPEGGFAAKASAAASNGFLLKTRLPPEEDNQGDRESGIVINSAASTRSLQQDSSEAESVTRVDFLHRLPHELASQILSHLDLRSLVAIQLVSRRWNEVASDRLVWRDVFYEHKSGTYATGKPISPGTGLGLPERKPPKDWKKVYKVRRQLERCWTKGIAQSIYLHGHQDSIYCIQFDENKIITGSRDKTIRVWDLETFKCTLVIGCPTVLQDLQRFERPDRPPIHSASGFADRHVVFSKPETVSFPMNHNASILCLQYDDDILVTGSSDSSCIIHDMKNGYKPIMRLQHHTLAVLDLAFDKNYIVTCSKDTTICVWERHTGILLKQLRGHEGPVNAIQLRGNSIVSCSGDTVVKLWNIDTGRIVREFQGHKKGLACSQFSEDSKLIASAGNDKTIRIWNANTGEMVREIEAHNDLVRSLHIDSVTGRLVSGSYDRDIKVWNMATGQLMLDFPKWHVSWVLGAKCDYRRIISTGQDPKILIMDFGYDVDGIELLESTHRSAERAERDAIAQREFDALENEDEGHVGIKRGNI